MNSNYPYINYLLTAIEWAFNDKRSAWIRTIDELDNKTNVYDLIDVYQAKTSMLSDAKRSLEVWYVIQYKNVTPSIVESTSKKESEVLWRELVELNTEPFINGPDPLSEFMVPVPSIKQGVPPLWLLPNLDGWGIRIYED
ncbi:hypothetical protein [Bacteroides sp. 51]|uniref:hypothetical protein n=1 Tax=Bacteroides sp. 51 TaxID=2302938 RepID=UPI0013D70750|nr:hypothetical protein [Bacteroides sp. 51]NDV84851.1 hypothetical protein [Bacteroides sp. 51]